jgi:hypothetical protein
VSRRITRTLSPLIKSKENDTKLAKPPPGYWQEKCKKVIAKFVFSIKGHFKEIEEASAELKQHAVTGVIGIEASKDCWEKICRDNASKLKHTSSGENEDKSFIWKGKVKDAEKYAQLSPCAQN